MPARLLPIFALAVSAVVAKPVVVRDSPITLPVARRFNATAAANIVKADQARAQALKQKALAKHAKVDAASPINVPVTNGAVTYTVSVGVGNPATTYDLIVDTGSSNTWVGAGKEYVQTSTSVDTGDEVEVSYGSGIFFGEEFLDTVTIGDLVLKNQSIGASEFAIGFDGVDGILGLGPVDLTEGTTSSGSQIPTVLDNALAQGLISDELVGISFQPTTSLSDTNGVLTFGGTDSSKFTGEIAYVPVTSTSPASNYVGIDQSITYGSAGTPILSATAGITDTGTTLVLIASDAFSAYQEATGGVPDDNTGLLKITADQFSNLESLFFHIGDNTYEFTPNAQIWPRALNTAIGGDADGVYLIVADIGSNSGEGLDFIDGLTFLERFYNVWDVANARVGFATTPFTDATTN
ncbi:aspartic proteinase precursor [Trametes polyzona]|nr:aspartic proteinase precursor [Trametes polyzona]